MRKVYVVVIADDERKDIVRVDIDKDRAEALVVKLKTEKDIFMRSWKEKSATADTLKGLSDVWRSMVVKYTEYVPTCWGFPSMEEHDLFE